MNSQAGVGERISGKIRDGVVLSGERPPCVANLLLAITPRHCVQGDLQPFSIVARVSSAIHENVGVFKFRILTGATTKRAATPLRSSGTHG